MIELKVYALWRSTGPGLPPTLLALYKTFEDAEKVKDRFLGFDEVWVTEEGVLE